MIEIVTRENNESLFNESWKTYILENPASPRYLPEMIKYQRAYTSQLIDDLSFTVLRNKIPIGIAFVPIEKMDSYLLVALKSSYVQAPLAVDQQAEEIVYSTLLALADEKKIDAIKFFLDPCVVVRQGTYNVLLDYGFLDRSISNGFIDLKDFGSLKNLRKGHRLNVLEIQKDPNFSIHLMDHSNSDYEVHEEYRRLHRICSGRETRSKSTFDHQYKILKDGNGILVGLKYLTDYIGFAAFVNLEKSAAYSSGADDPNYTEKLKTPVYHCLIWEAATYYKSKGVERIELSTPFGLSPQFDDFVGEKERNISLFKRGFRPTKVPFFRGVFYASASFFEEEVNKFRDSYSICIKGRRRA